MGGGKVIPDDEPPPPQNEAEGAIKKHKRHSLKTGDTQEAAHRQTAAGEENGQLGRPGDSTWREAGPPQGRGGDGEHGAPLARRVSSEETLQRHDHLTPTEASGAGGACVSSSIQGGAWGPCQL